MATERAQAEVDTPPEQENGQRPFEEADAMLHLDALYRTALRMTGNPQDADDLVQETYLRAFRFRDKFLPGSNLRAWLFKILSNAAISRFRHVKHETGDSSLDEM